MNDGVAGNNCTVVNMYVSAKQDTVHQNHIVENSAVVCDMAVRHEEIIVTDACDAVFFFSTAIDCHAFAKTVIVADHDFRVRILPADLLWFATDHRIWPERIMAADCCASGDDDVA